MNEKKKRTSCSPSNLCPKFEAAMKLLSKRWVGLIISQLLEGKKRFSEIEASIPISGKLLSERLKELEEADIVERKVYPETPVRIEYSLTEKGQALKSVIEAIEQWAQVWAKTDL
ncbi:winged helix-turn-helix transcriptional regulator [Thermaerobacillus caldiproteolyticus]|uniref:DNA-binding HxlR family transcriptional regulator n=1 Tax=Thermaerobacillus caldiproteolyticus TaxID=247480 RepID=A0A7V9Z702_9BACL|nr:helix-turn-helix domain-containing protein [Anoxybacillus caldiproteolyticus]MBA2875114.1 DNA-binding HxlR family transcriptional regulator [Anoxybacillus caldiproteolyticus]QPA32920.1 helix-turn-helix transcriptional regulator [Anoxybacillus caldiproteolyticus]